MALVFKTPITALNTTTRDIQNLSADCPPCLECPECPEVELTTAEVEYTENGSFTVTPESGFDGLSQVDITVNIDTQSIADEAYAEGEAAGIVTGKAQGVAEQKAKLTSTTLTTNGTVTREDGWNEVTVDVQPTLGTITVNPDTVFQELTPDEPFVGFATVLVPAVTASIDANIAAGNIKKDVSILGVTGSYDPQPDLETKSVTYTANDTYTITPTAGKDGMSSVEVTVNVSGSNCPDWSSIGWDCNDVTASRIEADLAYTAQKKAEYEAGTISMFNNDKKLVFAPKVVLKANLFKNSRIQYVPNLSADANISGVFEGCKNLKRIERLNTTGVTNMANMFYQTNLEEAPEMDMSSVTNASLMFAGSNQYDMINVKTFPQYDTSSVQNMSGMFSSGALTTAPSLNTSSVTNMSSMFSNCAYLETVPLYNTSSVTNMKSMFYSTNISTIPQFDTSNVESVDSMFSDCRSLTSLPALNLGKAKGVVSGMLQRCPNLTTLGGFIDFGKSFDQSDTSNNSGLYLAASTLLTKQSIMNIINNLAAPIKTTIHPKLTLSATSYALLNEEDIAIATAKNWSVVSA